MCIYTKDGWEVTKKKNKLELKINGIYKLKHIYNYIKCNVMCLHMWIKSEKLPDWIKHYNSAKCYLRKHFKYNVVGRKKK